MNLRVNQPLCQQYVDDMATLGEKIMVKDEKSYTASTDMGEMFFFVLVFFYFLKKNKECPPC